MTGKISRGSESSSDILLGGIDKRVMEADGRNGGVAPKPDRPGPSLQLYGSLELTSSYQRPYNYCIARVSVRETTKSLIPPPRSAILSSPLTERYTVELV